MSSPNSSIAESSQPPSVIPTTAPLVLSDDQERAANRVTSFILDPEQKNLVLKGYAGVGKSTLMKHVIDSLPEVNELSKLVGNDDTDREMLLTATTNKAAGALRQTTGMAAETIHSALGLTLIRNTTTHKQELSDTRRSRTYRDAFVIVDEAFMADNLLMSFMDRYLEDCKVLWIGDPAQLTPVGMNHCPLEARPYESVELTQVVRQAADSPIIQLATLFRYAVLTGKFSFFKPDGEIIQHVNRATFESKMLDAFDESGGMPGAVKTLAWTNKAAIGWNNHVKAKMKGSLEINLGDYVVVNKAMNTPKAKLSTDQTVQVTGKIPATEEGLDGHYFMLNDKSSEIFMPNSVDQKRALLRRLRRSGEAAKHAWIEDNWIDLRDEYACTVNKSQGSTYGTTFIDLDDISKCRSPNQLARMLYVATSRAAKKIVLTGDID